MGGRGARGVRAARAGGIGGGAFTVTPNAGGGVTITPNANAQNNANPQNIAGAGSGISDVNSHTTYFTPADMLTVSGLNSDGQRLSPRSGTMQNIGYYNTGDYYNINTELRDMANGRRSKLTPETQKVVDAMDRNMRPLNGAIDTVRWTDEKTLASNLGLRRGASRSDIINALSGQDITRVKSDYTSSSWDPKKNAVAGSAGRYVLQNMHYAKGAMAEFSPTRKEGEMVSARNTAQRFSTPRVQRMLVTNARGGRQMADVLVLDVYIDK